MRPIDADAIFPWYVEAFKGEIEPHDVRFSMHDIEMNLSNIPTIDAVPVIRCKDCKFSVKDEYNIFHGSEISNRCIAMGAVVSPDDYCSMAERKEE